MIPSDSALRATASVRRSQSTFSVGSLFDPGHQLPYTRCQDDQRRAGPGGALKAVLPHRLNGQDLFLPDPLFDSSFEGLSLLWSSVWASSLHPCIHSLLVPPLPPNPCPPQSTASPWSFICSYKERTGQCAQSSHSPSDVMLRISFLHLICFVPRDV